MAKIHHLRNLKCLEAIRWDCNLIILTIVYGNQDIHIQNIKNLIRKTSRELKLSIILVDNKGDYELSKLHRAINLEGQCHIDVYYYKKKLL